MSGEQSEHGSRAVFAPRGCLQHIYSIDYIQNLLDK